MSTLGGKLPLLCREVELTDSQRFILDLTVDSQSKLLYIEGESGTGKTYFLKYLLRNVLNTNSGFLCVYIDLLDDEFTTSNLFEYLVCMTWNENRIDDSTILNVSKDVAFSRYLKKKRFKKLFVRSLYTAIMETADMIPGFSGPVGKIKSIIKPWKGENPDILNICFEYFKWAAKRTPLIIALDNYQFLNRNIRLLIESKLGSIHDGICFIVVNRTGDTNIIFEKPICYRENMYEINMLPFDQEGTLKFLKETIRLHDKDSIDIIGRDCFLKTAGNPKLIELYAISLLQSSGKRLEGWAPETFLDTVRNLPHLARSIILLTSIFAAGLKKSFIVNTLRKLVSRNDDSEISNTFRELLAIGYIVINSAGGDTVRASHEKVIAAIRNCTNENELLEIRQLAIRTFDEMISADISPAEYYYLLHCLIGIMHFKEASEKMDKVISLIDYQYRSSRHHYIVSLYDAKSDIISFLPEMVVDEVLDSFQKTSEFSKGLEAIQKLKKTGFTNAAMLSIYSAKYQVQMYHYREALNSLNVMPQDEATLLYRLNALQCLAMNDEALQTINDYISNKKDLSEIGHIILRNSAHLYTFQEARINLLRALKYFESKRKTFAKATILNNLGIIYAWNSEIESASRSLLKAHDIMEKIGSNEIYQSKINIGVLEAIKGNYELSASYFQEAMRFIPRELLYDKLMLENNVAVLEIIQSKTVPQEALKSLKNAYYQMNNIEDPRGNDSIAFNIYEIENEFGLKISARPSRNFLRMLNTRKTTGFEVVKEVYVSNKKLKLLFILSPHWRY